MIGFQSRGFTLIELMLALLIAGVVLGLAVPSMGKMMERGQTTSTFNRLIGDLAFARSEAVKRGQPVVVCPSNNQSSCAGSDWSKGWLLFVDLDDDRAVDGGEDILRIADEVKSPIKVFARKFKKTSLSFGGDGKLEKGVAGDIGRLVVCDSTGDAGAKALTFSPFGQHRQDTVAAGDCKL